MDVALGHGFDWACYIQGKFWKQSNITDVDAFATIKGPSWKTANGCYSQVGLPVESY